MSPDHRIHHTDATAGLSRLPRRILDAIITSPPYASQRSKHYDSVSEKAFPGWMCDWMETAKPVLKTTGSVAVVLRSHVRDGAISDYVLKTRLTLGEAGWAEPEELLWIKPTAPPAGHKQRPRRSWEHILWFCPRENLKSIYIDVKANGQDSTAIGPMSAQGANSIYQDKYKQFANRALGIKTTKTTGRARTRDYVEVGCSGMGQEGKGQKWNTHPAKFPVEIPRWLIRMLSPPGGLVCDPFGGSGTTTVAAYLEGRRSILMDNKEEYIALARRRLHEAQVGKPGDQSLA